MMDLLGGSFLIKGCRRIGNKIKETAQQSLLFGARTKRNAMADSRLTAAMDRVHPVEGAVGIIRRSAILGWVYRYWGNLCATRLCGFLALLTPLLGLLAVRMMLAGRWLLAGGLLIALGLWLLLCGKGTLKDWLSGSLLGKRLSLPEGKERTSVLIYLGCCGAVGGAVGWFYGVVLAALVAVVLAAVPAILCIPPMGMVCLLLALLPVCGTSICWALSVAVVIVYFLARAFGTQAGRKIDGLDLLLMLFPLFCLISTAFSFHRADSLKVIVMWLGLYACVPFLRRIICTRRRLIAAVIALAAGATIAAFYGLFQFFSGMVDTTWTDTSLFGELELRVYSTFENPNVYGEFLLLMLPLVAGLALYVKGWKRWLLLGLDLLLMVNMVLTYSRGCYVGIALTALVFLWNLSKKWTVAAGVVGIPLVILMMPQSVMDRILSIGNMSDSSTSYRMMIYIGTFWMLTRYWAGGVGVGQEAFNAIYPYYALTGVVAYHSHSLIFQTLSAFGIGGLLYLASVWILYQRRTNGARRALVGKERNLMLGFSSAFWGMLVQSIFDYTWYNYRVFQLFWIVFMLGFAAVEVLHSAKEEEKQ